MSFSNVGKVWSAAEFRQYLDILPVGPWRPTAVTLHHTAEPSLAQRLQGLKSNHIENIRDFYKSKGWDRGPHLFVDEDQIFGMSPLSERGIHAVSFNATAIGIEVLGDYDSEHPKSGRGMACWTIAAAATRCLLDWLALPITEKTVLFHRDDPRTSKTCPGTKVSKDWVLDLIRNVDQSASEVPHPRNERVMLPVDRTIRERNPKLDFQLSTEEEDGRRVIYLTANGKKDEMEGAMYANGLTWAPESELRAYLP